QPVLKVVLSALVIGTFAIFYAAAGIILRAQVWKAAVPIFVVQFFLMNVLHHWLPNAPPDKALDAAGLQRLADRLRWDASAVMIATLVGYTCFVYASVKEGRRYFLAHAEIALA